MFNYILFSSGAVVRSVFWQKGMVVIGTQAGEIWEIQVKDKTPKIVVQVCLGVFVYYCCSLSLCLSIKYNHIQSSL